MRKICLSLLFLAAELHATVHYLNCSDTDGKKEHCVWTNAREPKACGEGKPCERLVVYFPGAQMPCELDGLIATSTLEPVMKAYRKRGFLFVAACPFQTMKGSTVPMVAQVARYGKLVKTILSDPWVTKRWTGQDLFLSGHSLGASVPVVAMARAQVDWQGSRRTAACFLDGVYDVYAANAFALTDPSCKNYREKSICARYFQDGSCPEVLPADHEQIQGDSILGADLSTFKIREWKLVECGSALSPCAFHGDWVPAGPIRDLCGRLENCAFESLPKTSHIECASDSKAIASCLDFFGAR